MIYQLLIFLYNGFFCETPTPEQKAAGGGGKGPRRKRSGWPAFRQVMAGVSGNVMFCHGDAAPPPARHSELDTEIAVPVRHSDRSPGFDPGRSEGISSQDSGFLLVSSSRDLHSLRSVGVTGQAFADVMKCHDSVRAGLRQTGLYAVFFCRRAGPVFRLFRCRIRRSPPFSALIAANRRKPICVCFPKIETIDGHADTATSPPQQRCRRGGFRQAP